MELTNINLTKIYKLPHHTFFTLEKILGVGVMGVQSLQIIEKYLNQ